MDKLEQETFKLLNHINTIRLDHKAHSLETSLGLLTIEADEVGKAVMKCKDFDSWSQGIEYIWNNDKLGLYQRIAGVFALGTKRGIFQASISKDSKGK